MTKRTLIALILIVSISLISWGCTGTPSPSESPSEPLSEVPSESPPVNPATPTSTISNQTGIITEITGTVTVLVAGSTNWAEASVGMQLGAGDRIKTEADSSALITFFEGSIMELQQNTEISIAELSSISETKTSVISLEQKIGKTRSRVTKLLDTGSRYEITTASGSAVVRGTEYVTEVFDDGTTIVKVYDGSVRAEREGQYETVHEGYQITFVPGEPLGQPQPLPETEREWGGGGGGSPTLEADFEANPTNGITLLTVQFADRSKGKITARLWDFGDDAISTDQNPTHTYSDPGSYTVSLTVYSSGLSDAEIKSNYITVYAPGDDNQTLIFGEIVPL